MAVTDTVKETVKGALGTSDEPRESLSTPNPISNHEIRWNSGTHGSFIASLP